MERREITRPATELKEVAREGRSVNAYLDAIERLDAAHVAEPATALADLLAARLEGADSPAAREFLESLAATEHREEAEDSS